MIVKVAQKRPQQSRVIVYHAKSGVASSAEHFPVRASSMIVV